MTPNLPGIVISSNGNAHYCAVKQFSKELQTLIREQLAGVWHGFPQVEDAPAIHSYQRTLASFIDRYKNKSSDTQKGMIGELLAHILIGHYFNDLQSLSVLKNKEERSIKKGFDIVYYQLSKNGIWYSEVKSGEKNKGSKSTDESNAELLNRSHTDLKHKFGENRDSLWETAQIDIILTVKEAKGKIKLQDLLDRDAPVNKPKNKKNGILISVLYHCPNTEPLSLQNIIDFHADIRSENVYQEEIVLSIQKTTFDKIAKFLESEILP